MELIICNEDCPLFQLKYTHDPPLSCRECKCWDREPKQKYDDRGARVSRK